MRAERDKHIITYKRFFKTLQISYQKLWKPEESGPVDLNCRKENCQPRFLYLAKLPFRIEEETKMFQVNKS